MKVTDLRFQLSRFLAIVNNRSIAHEATAKALNSEGSAMRENEKYMQSFEARINRMKVAWQEFALTMGEAVVNDSIITLTSSLTTLAKWLGYVVENAGVVPPVLGTVGLASGLLSKNFRTLVISTITLGNGMKSLGVSASVAKASLRSLAASTGVGLVFVGIGFALEYFIGRLGDVNEEIENFQDSHEKLLETISDRNNLQNLSDEYDKLATKTNATTEEKIRLFQIESELQSQFGLSIAPIDSQSDAYERNNTLIKENIELKRKQIEEEQNKAKNDFLARETEINKNIENARKEKEEAEEAKKIAEGIQSDFKNGKIKVPEGNIIDVYKDAFSIHGLNTITKVFGSLSPDGSFVKVAEESIIKDTQHLSEKIATNVSEATKNWEEKSEVFNNAIKVKKNAFNAEFQGYIDSLEKNGEKIKPVTRVLSEAVATILSQQGGDTGEFQKVSDNFKEIFNIFQSNEVNSLEDAVSLFENLPDKIKPNGDVLNFLKQELKRLNFKPIIDDVDEFTDGMEEAGEKTKTYSEKTDDAISSIETLSSAYTTLNNGEDLSLSTLSKLINNYPTLSKYLSETNDLTFNRGKIIKQVAQDERDAMVKSLEMYEVFLINMKAKEDALFKSLMSQGLTQQAIARINEVTNADPTISNIRGLIRSLSSIDFDVPSVNWGGGGGSSSSKSDKSPEELAKEARKQAFKAEMDSFNFRVKYHKLNANEQLYQLNRIAEKHKQYLSESLSDERDYLLAVQDLTETRLKEKQDAIEEENKLREDSFSKLISRQKDWESSVRSSAEKALSIMEDYYAEQLKKDQDNLDEKFKQTEDTLNRVMDLLDRSNETDDYNKDLAKKQNEELEIRTKIDQLALDNSIEAQAKKKDLEKELADKVEEIKKFQLDRTRRIERQNLQDTINNARKSTEIAKDEAETKWKNIMNADEKYTSMREQLLNGHWNALQISLKSFADTMDRYMIEVGDSINRNLIMNFKDLKDEIDKIGVAPKFSEEELAFQKYIANKNEYYSIFSRDKTNTDKRQIELASENARLRERYNFPDYTIEDLRSKGLTTFHTGGEVGTSTRAGSILHKLLNKNEVPSILKMGELVLKDPLQSLKNIASMMMPNYSNVNFASAGGKGDTHITLNFDIARLEGGEKGANTLLTTIHRELKKKGL